MGLHVGYEAVDPFALGRIDVPAKKLILGDRGSQGLLRSEPERGVIHVDTETQLTGVPSETWRYRLGNRSAIEWILDQYKEKTPRDPIIGEKFNTYRFADHKEEVVELLKRVTRVSVETMRIVDEMRTAKR